MSELNREQAKDILDKMEFFQGQRAGRELWNEKSFDVQEQDLANFSRDVALLKNYIKELTEENERLRAEKEAAVDDLKHCMYYANPKRANTCNFCIHDCEVSKDGTKCKGKDDWIYCSPVWRGVVKTKSEGE